MYINYNIIHILSPSYAPVLLSSMHTVGLTIRQQGAFLVAKCAQKFLHCANTAFFTEATKHSVALASFREWSFREVRVWMGMVFGMVLTNNFTYFLQCKYMWVRIVHVYHIFS